MAVEIDRSGSFTRDEIEQLSALVNAAVDHEALKAAEGAERRDHESPTIATTEEKEMIVPPMAKSAVNNETDVDGMGTPLARQWNESDQSKAGTGTEQPLATAFAPSLSPISNVSRISSPPGEVERRSGEREIAEDVDRGRRSKSFSDIDVAGLMRLVNTAMIAREKMSSHDETVIPPSPNIHPLSAAFGTEHTKHRLPLDSGADGKLPPSPSPTPPTALARSNSNNAWIAASELTATWATGSSPYLDTLPPDFDIIRPTPSTITDPSREATPNKPRKRKHEPRSAKISKPRKSAKTRTKKSPSARPRLGDDPNRPGLITLYVHTPLDFTPSRDLPRLIIKLSRSRSATSHPRLPPVEVGKRPIDVTPVHNSSKSQLAVQVPHSYPDARTPARQYIISKLDPHMKDLMRYLATARPQKPFAAAAAFLKERSELVEGPWMLKNGHSHGRDDSRIGGTVDGESRLPPSRDLSPVRHRFNGDREAVTPVGLPVGRSRVASGQMTNGNQETLASDTGVHFSHGCGA